uniref:Uncharacterized protein TCIL3000_11_3750 n=1 Tax=Trypanosoma congolense (strain IL3000) TaxID=1068625 RepID=G0V006_TRYCI|nr:unnamed protein product [Trypanosoma congolense IL3000]
MMCTSYCFFHFPSFLFLIFGSQHLLRSNSLRSFALTISSPRRGQCEITTSSCHYVRLDLTGKISRKMKAKRDSRSSVKGPRRIPYTASSPFETSKQAATSERSPWREPLAFVSRVVSAVGEKLSPSPRKELKYGDVLRDVPFHIHDRVVAYFSSHPTLCIEAFGVSHGQCLRFTHGPWARSVAVVIGARGGKLWVLDKEGPVAARPLFTVEQHDWEKIDDDGELLKKLRDGIAVARDNAELDYDGDQREFLQKAPDLFVEVVDDDVDNLSNYTSSIRSTRGSCARSIRSERCTTGVTTVVGMDDGVFELPERTKKRVILVPQVTQVTGDVGWAGEGLVVLNGGGVKYFTSSLSASILL